MANLEQHEIGHHCSKHPKAALKRSEIKHKFVCSECHKEKEKADKVVKP